MEDTMLKAESVLSLSLRLRYEALRQMRRGRRQAAADIRLAAAYLRQYATLIILDEAKAEKDPSRKRQLEDEACATWVQRFERRNRGRRRRVLVGVRCRLPLGDGRRLLPS
jgi:hypothetical protein